MPSSLEHLKNQTTPKSGERFPASADRCPHCGGMAVSGFAPGGTSVPPYAYFECGTCFGEWKVWRLRKKQYPRNRERELEKLRAKRKAKREQLARSA